MKYLLTLLMLATLSFAGLAQAATDANALRGKIKVAFAISDNANVMDIAGPWEVFQDTMLDDGRDTMPFELYTVAPSKSPLHTTGSGRRGMTITPDYSFDDAPVPDIVVVGAQSGGAPLRAWLQKLHAQGKTVLSICSGAYELARAGLLHGKPATTHHWHFGDFAEEFPDTKLVREVRYVQADPYIYTAGGLTSGVDLALHIVATYFGQAQAQRTADYLEYMGEGWKSNAGVAALKAPIKHHRWSGKIGPDTEVSLHVVMTGASATVTTDIPARRVSNATTKVKSDGRTVRFSLPVGSQLATFTGTVEPGGKVVKGSFTQGKVAEPLTLSLQEP